MSNPRTLVTQAFSYINATPTPENTQSALQLLNLAGEAKPQGTACLQLALAYIQLGEHDRAQAVLAQTASDFKNNPAYYLFASLLAIDMQDFDSAQKNLAMLRQICPLNQALPCAEAAYHLSRHALKEALAILVPEQGSLDPSASQIVTGRLAVLLEKLLLPTELPTFLPAITAPQTNEDNSANTDAASALASNPKLVNGSDEPVDVLKTVNSGKQESPGAASNAKSTTEACSGSIEQEASKSQSSSFMSNGSKRLQNAWSLPPEKRQSEILAAVELLQDSYDKSPTAYQAAFNLGEGLLATIEYCRERSLPLNEEDIVTVKRAESLFEESLVNDSVNAYSLHYLARTAFLQKNFVAAEAKWRQALAAFAKLPEAHYGLGQTLVMLNREREGRQYLVLAMSSDLHMLKDRIFDLQYAYTHNPQAWQ